MTVRDYSFDERLAMSQGVSLTSSIDEILIEAIPGAIGTRNPTPTEDRAGTDRWVDQFNGNPLSVNVKVRQEDWAAKHGADDLALEIWSVVEERIPGWTRDARKRTDYTLWYWQDTGRWCLLAFPMLCAVFVEHVFEWASAYQVARQRTDGRYHSECVFVPRLVVWRAIYERFGGKAAA